MDERDEWDRMFWNGVEMRGGLARGHQHMAFLSEPDMRCPACVEWAHEIDGETMEP